MLKCSDIFQSIQPYLQEFYVDVIWVLEGLFVLLVAPIVTNMASQGVNTWERRSEMENCYSVLHLYITNLDNFHGVSNISI